MPHYAFIERDGRTPIAHTIEAVDPAAARRALDRLMSREATHYEVVPSNASGRVYAVYEVTPDFRVPDDRDEAEEAIAAFGPPNWVRAS